MTPAVVELVALGRTYPGHPPVRALRPCSLQVRAGDFVTVVGPSGSGKSTLLNVLGLLDRPSEGVYLLDGEDVAALSERQRTRVRGTRIGFVFQSFQLLRHRSAVENVMLPLAYQGVPRAEQQERAEQALVDVGLGHRRQALPSHMSGGERQRVAVARALVTRPSILLCDEPTGNLDSTTTGAVLGLFRELNSRGTTIVLITHDPAVAAEGTRRVVIRDGLLEEPEAASWAS
ncbi:ABC transporter ATP-binding protein [Nocardioides yefusunii]|uniref:ABC transporter ATP-binding protein n=1 Tax=Nocardioides yefusunii TaxID=2500546 RepID=A0ABW1R0W9_9ACTN|nr:ABC transporter ATP-binding protein [Nocardioides yefusunii]